MRNARLGHDIIAALVWGGFDSERDGSRFSEETSLNVEIKHRSSENSKTR